MMYTEHDCMRRLGAAERAYEEAQQRHDLDGMIKATKEHQIWGERLSDLHDKHAAEQLVRMCNPVQ